MPLISVVIPAHNASATLNQTLAALRAQTWDKWEAFVIDDGSTDGTRDMATAWAALDPRIRVHANPGKGPSAARNFAALDLARGDVLAFCDADDIWLPGKLLDVAEAILGAGADAAYGRIGFFSHDPACVQSRSSVPQGRVTLPMLLGENPVGTMSNLSLLREVYVGLGGLRDDMVHNEDLEFLIRLVGMQHALIGLDRDHVLYRLSPAGLSANLGAMRAARDVALATADLFGYAPTAAHEAIHLRYLARRALRLDAPTRELWSLVGQGLRSDPAAFLLPLRRGGLIALAAALRPVLPKRLRHTLFRR
ncbi:glycosyltransferase family 2 protein [Tropicibacter oceani]|uniref:Glycosyltransferase family 2 protein n=1 Tax=Tropicibacter oceani TaxID=3058420 RepID=A0ABY8QEH2_9RHOB|nr:glycosyltransferase family 2 protein [Tropicibacter oceani]WGW02403.1 glycosyltransferase family 2 protein [Tropicibacter oceani]